jgi:hypothetical protein
VNTLKIIDLVNGHGLDDFVTGELAHILGALLACLLGLLHGHQLVYVQGEAQAVTS